MHGPRLATIQLGILLVLSGAAACGGTAARADDLPPLRPEHPPLFTADISEATVVTLYLSTSVNARLEPKLRRELRPGTRIVSHQFRIGNWPPQQTVRVENEELFLWTVPPP